MDFFFNILNRAAIYIDLYLAGAYSLFFIFPKLIILKLFPDTLR